MMTEKKTRRLVKSVLGDDPRVEELVKVIMNNWFKPVDFEELDDRVTSPFPPAIRHPER